MNIYTAVTLLSALLLTACSQQTDSTETINASPQQDTSRPTYAMVIHGGAGTILKKNMTPEKEAEYREAMNAALDIGEEILKNGGSSADAVEQTIVFMENSPLFNSGKGAVFTNAGINELDASFMDGATLNAGAVGGVTVVKNPIKAARAVLEKSDHVMLVGKGAEQFAEQQGLEIVDNEYFYTERRFESLQRAKAAESNETGFIFDLEFNDHKFGTVGCVALDKDGNIVAGTSTGGMTNKRYNRIGDSPIIGAGTYANNATCGVSSTGHGEYFIRYAVAHDISAMMEYKGVSLQEAANTVINEKLKAAGGTGGVVALDKNGNVAMPFNTAGMYRGYAKPGERVVQIYEDE